MDKRNDRSGFTLVELSLSIVFISILSVSVALIISNAISAYHRGVIMNQVNTIGMDLVDDMRAAIQDSRANTVVSMCAEVYGDRDALKKCEEDSAQRFVMVIRKANVTRKGGQAVGEVPVQGAFCTGTYSYLWNSGYLFNSTDYQVEEGGETVGRAKLKYRLMNTNGVKTKEDFRLIKIRDDQRAVCKSTDPSKEYPGAEGATNLISSGDFDISDGIYKALSDEPVDLLGNGENNLALYDLAARVSAESEVINNAFYSVSFILATVQGGININASGDYCVAPGDLANSAVEGFDYCAINKFNFAAQANGGE